MSITTFKIQLGIYLSALFAVASLAACGNASAPTENTSSTLPTVEVAAASVSLIYDGSTTVSWSSTNSAMCATSGGIGGSGGTGTSGSFSTAALTETTTYSVTCVGTGGSVTKEITITVAPSVINSISGTTGNPATVNSANSLYNGAIVTISGTTSYDGQHVVSNVTSISFTIDQNYVTSDTTGSWRLAGGMVSGCSTTATAGSLGAITPTIVPSRFNGVAPLSVFFDTAGTVTSPATEHPFHELEYRWSFGDPLGSPVSGTTWGTGSRPSVSSRNAATGPVTAHVYERPGTYYVTLEVTDGTNTVSNSCARIVVQDPDVVFAGTNTICINAAAPTPVQGAGGCPAGADVGVQPDFTAAISSYALTGKRVLFKTDDTFIAATSAGLRNTGPGIVGSYGPGALPVIQMTGNTNTLGFSSKYTPDFKDWRVMDLEFDGMNTTYSKGVGIDGLSGGLAQLTLLRLTLRNFWSALGIAHDVHNYLNNLGTLGNHRIDQVSIVDSTVTAGANTVYGGYNSGSRISFMGNNLDNGGNPTGSHVTRWTYLNKAVISNNTLSRPGNDRLLIKLHAPKWLNGLPTLSSDYSPYESGDAWSKQIVISDNKGTDFANPYSFDVGPQNGSSDERVRDVILERNLHIAAASTQVSQVLDGAYMTSRNNIIDSSNGSIYQTGIRMEIWGIVLPGHDFWIYNNSQFSSKAAQQFYMVHVRDTPIENVTIKNNLAYAPNVSLPLAVKDAGAINVVVSNNSTDAQIKTTNPFSLTTPPVNLADWIPQVSSYAIDAGTAAPTWSDFRRAGRPQGSGYDMGAIETP